MRSNEKKAMHLICLLCLGLLLSGIQLYAQAATYLSDLTWVSAWTD